MIIIFKNLPIISAILVCIILQLQCNTVLPINDTVPVVINEFMTKNTSENSVKIIDEYGETDDWVELYNTAASDYELQGLYLSDDSTHLQKYALFDTIIPSHGYLIVWTDGHPKQGTHHADFKLSATNGDELILSDKYGQIIDRIQFFATSGNPDARLPDQSYGRSTDGDIKWCHQILPTPYSANSGCLVP